MPRKSTPLTATKIRQAKAHDFPLWDGGGLHLILTASGSHMWRWKYFRPDGRENRLALGSFPEVSLADARRFRDNARAKLREGIDPAEQRKAVKDAARRVTLSTFEAAAARWLDVKRKEWAPETLRKAQYVTDTYLVPMLQRESIATLGTPKAAATLERISASAPALAAKARQYLGGIVNQAIRDGLREDGKLLSLRGAVPKHEKGHIPAATDPREVAALVKAIDAYSTPVTRSALKLAMYTAMRPGIVASARWDEIDLDAAEWTVAAARMKTRHAHIVPLPTQALAVLRDMLPYSTGREYVFPPLARQRTPHLHRDALSNALRRMGFQGRHATHGFRGMLRTVARERLGADIDVLEAQLAHAKKGEVQKAYDRTTFGDDRRRVMLEWANYLDALKHGGKVVPIKRKAS